jgi:hypothetical protein
MKRWTCAAAVISIWLALPARPADPEVATKATLETRSVAFINSQRAANGLPALAFSPPLAAEASAWTDHLMAANSISENPDLGAHAPPGWAALGENVGMGGSLDLIDTSYWNSPPHRANILGKWDAVGVGVDQRGDGTLFTTAIFVRWQPGVVTSICPRHTPAAPPSLSTVTGYEVLGAGGSVYALGGAPPLGSAAAFRGKALAMAVTPDQLGSWVLSTAGVFAFGDAKLYAPTAGGAIDGVDLKPTRSGSGYWVLGRDGSVDTFGDAVFHGALPSIGIHTQAVKLVITPTGGGYWILGADGGIFSFGDAVFHGSVPGLGISDSAVSLAATPSGGGYWILGADGGIFSFGDAVFHGSVPGLGCRIWGTQIVTSGNGQGYYVLSISGEVFAFGNAPPYGQLSAPGLATLDLTVFTG